MPRAREKLGTSQRAHLKSAAATVRKNGKPQYAHSKRGGGFGKSKKCQSKNHVDGHSYSRKTHLKSFQYRGKDTAASSGGKAVNLARGSAIFPIIATATLVQHSSLIRPAITLLRTNSSQAINPTGKRKTSYIIPISSQDLWHNSVTVSKRWKPNVGIGGN